MNEINIPFNVRVKVNGKVYSERFKAGKFIIKSKSMPKFIMLFHASVQLFMMSIKHLIGGKS